MSRKNQIQQLLAVCLFAYLPAIIYSVYILISGVNVDYTDTESSSWNFSIIQMVLALTLLAKVLSVRGRTLNDIGITYSFRRVIGGLPLAISAYILYALAYSSLNAILPPGSEQLLEPRNIGHVTGSFSWLLLLGLLINPVCEELIARGFLMTEIFSLTGSKTAAVSISVLFQSSYHLYQGLYPALLTGVMFLLFSLFFIKTGNLPTVVIAHMILDLALLAR